MNRIKELRQNLGLSQADFARPMGFSPSNISKLENGDSQLTPATATLICSTYHVNPRWLAGENVGMYETADIDALIDQRFPDQSPFMRSIIKGMMRLPDEDWKRLNELYDKIKKEGL